MFVNNYFEIIFLLLLGDMLLCSLPMQIPVESVIFNTTVFRYLEVTKYEINHNWWSKKI